LIDLARWWAAIRPDDAAIVTPGDRVTFSELNAWADALAEWMIAEGLQPRDRISILASNSLEWCALAQGILRAGGLLAPLNFRYTVSEASLMVDRFKPKFVFYDGPRHGTAQKIADMMPSVRLQEMGAVARFRHRTADLRSFPEISPETEVVIIATSGSTAMPKGVVYSHRTMLSYIGEFALAEPRATDHARMLLFAPLSTSAGYVLLTQYLAYGGTIYADEQFDAARALKRIIEDKITAVMGAPVFLERIAACEGFRQADLSHVRMTSVGGARVTRQLVDAWMSKGVLLRQIYGQTEAGGQSTINTLEASVTDPDKCGRGMPFTRLRIIDAEGRPCPPGTAGEILIRGPGLMVGYWNDPEATAKALVDGWLHTGDLGVMDEQGLLTFVDRLKDIIISGGLNISAAEVERCISEFPGVDEVAVIAAQDDRFGETPLAVVYSSSAVDVAKLIDHCNTQLSNYKVPRYVALEGEPLPRLATGKIAKPPLRAKYADAHLRLPRVR
jgi:fatty-acyl-CoA synthase